LESDILPPTLQPWLLYLTTKHVFENFEGKLPGCPLIAGMPPHDLCNALKGILRVFLSSTANMNCLMFVSTRRQCNGKEQNVLKM